MTHWMRLVLVPALLAAVACGKLPPATAGVGEPCTRNADCAAPYICSDAKCVLDAGRACNPGDLRCNGATVEKCGELGDKWVAGETCATGCSEGACLPSACSAGSVKCDAGVVYTCLSSGAGWAVDHTCLVGCAADKTSCAAPACTPYATGCDDADPTVLKTCDERGDGWQKTVCPAENGVQTVCAGGRCLAKVCVPAAGGTAAESRCAGDVRETCDDTGTAWAEAEVCQFGCVLAGSQAACAPAACSAGDTRCDGTAVEKCAPDRRSFAFVQFCPAGCQVTGGSAGCVKPVCQPLQRLCGSDPVSGANIVTQCRADGSGFDPVETCPQACSTGTCVTDDAHCNPGDRRCNGVETQLCVSQTNGTTEWQFLEHCLGTCQGAACDGSGACGCADGTPAGNACGSTTHLPIALNAMVPAGASLPADNGLSSFLLYTDPVTDAEGNLVPDGTLVTFTQDGTDSLFVSGDAAPQLPGMQRPTLRGRARVLVRSPQVARDVVIGATLGGSCNGTATLHFASVTAGQPHSAYVAEDFSTYRLFDRVNSTASWDAQHGIASGTPVFAFGSGADGDFDAASGSTQDLWDLGYAKGWNVVGIGTSSVQTDTFTLGLAAGDEVLLVNAVSTTQNAGNVAPTAGAYEFKHVDRVAAGTVYFTEPVVNQYGFASNADLTGQHVVVQRVPQFNNFTVEAAATVTARPYANGGSGILALRARGTVKVIGQLSMTERGLPPSVTQTGATTPALNRFLLGSGQTRAGGGVLFVSAKAVTVKNDAGVVSGQISASSLAGSGGQIWLSGASLVLSTNNVQAAGTNTSVDGRVRLDYATLDNGAATRPTAFTGQSGPFYVQSLTAYTEPSVTSGKQLAINAATLLGALGGAGATFTGLPAAIPGLHVDLSIDGGLFIPADTGRITVSPGGHQVRFRGRLDTVTDSPMELLGIALKFDAS